MPRTLLLLFCAGIIANGLIFFILLSSTRGKTTFSLLEWIVSFAAVLFFLYQFEIKKKIDTLKSLSMLAEQSMLKDYELSLINLLEESEEDSGK